MQPAVQVIVILMAIGSGIVGGVFFAFSTFVMRALGDLPASNGIAAMQRINVVVISPWFMTPFLGTAALAMAIVAMRLCHVPGVTTLATVGGGLCIVGTFGVTIFGNVPLNNRLALLESSSDQAAKSWVAYPRNWMRWNHLRTVAAIASSVAIGL